MGRVFYPLIPGAYFAIDVFYFVSAFLATYLLAVRNYEGKFNILKAYLHRFIRLWPAVTLFTFFLMTFNHFLVDGPLSAVYEDKLVG